MSAEPAVDPRGPRFSAWITSIILILVLVTGSWRLLAAQAVLFGLCAFIGLRLNPWGQVFRHVVQPRLAPPTEHEAAEPLRFAQGVGFVFALIGTIGYVSGLTTLGTVATAFALIAAFVNAAFGYCMGCEMYLLIRRFVPARTGADS